MSGSLLQLSFSQNVCMIWLEIEGIPTSTNSPPLVADLLLFCYEIQFSLSLYGNNQADVIEIFKSTSRYLDELLDIDNPYFR